MAHELDEHNLPTTYDGRDGSLEDGDGEALIAAQNEALTAAEVRAMFAAKDEAAANKAWENQR